MPIASTAPMTLAGGAAPATMACTGWSMAALASGGMLTSALSTMGAPHMWVTCSSWIRLRIFCGSTRRRHTCTPAMDVGHLDAHCLDRADDLGRRRCAGDHGVHRMVDGGLGFRGHVDQRVEHDGRAAHVGDLLVVDQVEDLLRVDPAQAHVHTGHGRGPPGVAPAVAVEHRQGPQVDRVLPHVPGHLVAHGVEEGTAVVIDHTLGVAGGAGGVVEADGVPL